MTMNAQDQEIALAIGQAIYAQLAAGGQVLACDGSALDSSCAQVLWSSFTIEDFLRSGQTSIDQLESGTIPIVPGQNAVLTQASHPGWGAGCIRITYRLANNGTNHGDIRFDFFVDGTALDRPLYGSDIYDNANNMIGDGYNALPLQGRKQCCIGGMNKLRVKITHEGLVNQLEQPRIVVQHGKRACCSGCAVGRECQAGCSGEKPKNGGFVGQGSLQVNINGTLGGGNNGNGGGPIQALAPPTPPPGNVLVQGANGIWFAVPASKMLAAAS